MLLKRDHASKAAEYYRVALADRPDHPEAHNGLQAALLRLRIQPMTLPQP